MPPLSLFASCDGDEEEVRWDHEEVSCKMGGSVTFVGAIDDLHVFAVALSESDHEKTNPLCNNADVFMALPVRGPVVFVATDDDGNPMDVDVHLLRNRLHAKEDADVPAPPS
jgi:hypothetical protein